MQPIIKAFEGKPLYSGTKQILDRNGYYASQFHQNMEEAGCIALFGANASHFNEAKDGIQSGSGQAAGLRGAKGAAGYKHTMPIDTMSASNHSDHQKALAAMRYMFWEAKKLDKLSIIVPMKRLSQEDVTKLQSENALHTNTEAKKWADNLNYGEKIVNIGFGICKNPDLDLLYEVNKLVNNFQCDSGDIKSINTKKKQMEYWNKTVLEHVKQIASGSTQFHRVEGVETDDVTKFKTVLQGIRTQNADLAQLSAEKVMSIFTDAHTNKYYTNAPSGEPQLPLDGRGNFRSDEEAKLMRKFSVEFQKECKVQGLTFSNTAKDNVNTNGMRTKSVVAFLNQNNNGDIESLIKKAGWNK